MSIQIVKFTTMWGDLRMEITLLLIIGFQSINASMDKEATNSLGKVTEGRQDVNLTTEEEKTMDRRGRQFLDLELIERQGKTFEPSSSCYGFTNTLKLFY